jgi:hypothetical protein
MLDLKAVVSEKEEERMKKKRAASGFGEEDEQQLRRLRGTTGGDLGAVGASKDVFARSNKGITDRQAADSEALDAEKARKRRGKSSGVLEKKAELYEKLKRGALDPEAAKKAGFLVDFEAKQPAGSSYPSEFASGAGHRGSSEEASWQDRARKPEVDDDVEEEARERGTETGEVEVEDEFGRCMVVPRGSQEHLAHQSRRRALAEEQEAEIAKQQGEEDDVSARQQQQRGDEQFRAGDRHQQQQGQQHEQQQHHWPVSSGAQRPDCGDWGVGGDTDDNGDRGRGLGEFYDDVEGALASRGDGVGDGVGGGVGGGVKSKWDQTLSDRDKGFLREVIAEEKQHAVSKKAAVAGAAVGSSSSSLGSAGHAAAAPVAGAVAASAGGGGGQRRDFKAERRELLRKKAEERELKKFQRRA